MVLTPSSAASLKSMKPTSVKAARDHGSGFYIAKFHLYTRARHAYQWYVYKSGRVKMKRGLSRWQLPLLTITDRSGHRFLEQIKNRSIPVIDAALSPVVAMDAVLCTDGAAAYARFSTKNGMVHHVLSNKPCQRIIHKAFHIQNVNSLHSLYDEFMRPFEGSASKYLKLCLRWFLLRSRLSS